MKVSAEKPKEPRFEDLDYVHVVRCKDCKKQISCTIYVEAVQEENENWFCADGKRKD